MEYEMKQLGCKYPDEETLKQAAATILLYLKGNARGLTEIKRQFMCWGADKFMYIVSEDGCYGLQFKVRGLKHRGRVRIYYNPGTDYYDVELLRALKDEMIWGCSDLDFTQLHNVLHQHIERDDDPEIELA